MDKSCVTCEFSCNCTDPDYKCPDCDNNFSEWQESEMAESRREVAKLREALSLANSMILCGEMHSEESKRAIYGALRGGGK